MLSFFIVFYHLFCGLYALSSFHSAQHSILSGLLQKFILRVAQYSGYSSVHDCMLSWFSRVQLFATPWTVAHQVCPWNPPGKNTGMGDHAFLQEIFLTQASNPHLLHLLHCRQILLPLSHQGSPYSPIRIHNSLSKVPGHAGSKVGNIHTQMLQYKHPLWVSPSRETGSQEVVSAWITSFLSFTHRSISVKVKFDFTFQGQGGLKFVSVSKCLVSFR